MSDLQNGAGDEQLAGTVKLYRRHVVVLTAQADWPSHLDQADGLPGALLAAVADHADRLGDVKVTAATGNTAARGHDVLVFPDMVRYCAVGADHPEADLAALVEDHLLAGRTSTRLVSEPLTGHHLFVCVHAARDQRCGDQGPELAAAVERELAERGLHEVTVRRSSHVGGHRFAGCLIAYPAGDWYGMLSSELAPRLVDQCVARNRILAGHWRGRLGQEPAAQLQTAAELRMGTDTDYSGRPVTRPEYGDKPPPRRPRRSLAILHTRDGISVTKTAAGWYTVDENLELGERVDDPKFDWS